MATATRLRQTRATSRGPFGDAGQVLTAYNVVTFTGGILALNEVQELVRLPTNAVVLGIQVVSGDLDTGGAPSLVFSIGDAAAPARLMAATTIGQAGGNSEALAAAGLLFAYAAPTTINMTVTAAGNAAVTVNATLAVCVRYFVR
jgi:hypothetical protein